MKTYLYERHLKLGAKMVDFCGWQMPLQYSSILQEHLNVRQHVGIFDVSHMARIIVEGEDAESFLDYLSTNKITGKKDFTATYTLWCRDNGTCIDDVIVYKKNKEHFFVIVNACNRQKDLLHLESEVKSRKVKITPLFSDGILALQGPKSSFLMQKLFPEAQALSHMHFLSLKYKGHAIILSATGYTGEEGFEIYGPGEAIAWLWDELLLQGQPYNIMPIGLGARDTLRLEKGYALYGHELSDEILGVESVSSWTIKWDKPIFLGKQAMQEVEKSSNKRYEYGMLLLDPGIAREGYAIYKNNKPIGQVTSGTFSPSLNQAIALVLVNEKLKLDERVNVQIRQNFVEAKIVELPFVRIKNEIY